ncbi:hypothetical protein M426DRAFT_220643 [Hypoxylon sp. CI-4A]|nr:hypothetical protein M426DRAFT_220643 [Hypoxylon sp. CI-4A]
MTWLCVDGFRVYPLIGPVASSISSYLPIFLLANTTRLPPRHCRHNSIVRRKKPICGFVPYCIN